MVNKLILGVLVTLALLSTGTVLAQTDQNQNQDQQNQNNQDNQNGQNDQNSQNNSGDTQTPKGAPNTGLGGMAVK